MATLFGRHVISQTVRRLLVRARVPLVACGTAAALCSVTASHAPAQALKADAPAPGKFKLALIQLLVGKDKAANLKHAEVKIREAAASGAQLISLPECFNSPYGPTFFPEYAEEVPATSEQATESANPSTLMLSKVAKELKIYLVGGSFPERDATTGKLYNTCLVFGPDGSILCRHRKMHLFDIDIPGKMTMFESDTLTGGDDLSLFDTPWGRVGVGICYDIRFPHLAALLRMGGAHMLIYPGAFNMTTGPMHWELLARARAVDNQAFIATPSPARNPESSYQAWGHTSIISPWGKVVATTEEAPAIVYADVDLAEVLPMRQAIPVFNQTRDDLYSLKWTKGTWLKTLGLA